MSSRPRANTTTFAFSSWRKPQLAPQPSSPPQTYSVERLIDRLTPPKVPSLAHARSLASLLPTCSPVPRHSLLIPIVMALCDQNSPSSLQAAGFDIMSAYWENDEAVGLSTQDRMTLFSVFDVTSTVLPFDIWEPRLKALRLLTKYGAEIIGIEIPLINLLKSWILDSFEGLLRPETLERAARAERERSIDLFATFLTSIVENPQIVARLPEAELLGVLQFYGSLVDRSVDLPSILPTLPMTSPMSDSSSSTSTPSRPSPQSHRRNQSSVSVTSIPSPTSMTPPLPPLPQNNKLPIDIAINLYLNHLTSQNKSLSPTLLDSIMPLLFRAISFCASPLPRLILMPQKLPQSCSEDKIAEALTALFSGPYSSTCFMILKRQLYPPSLPDIDNG